MHNIILAVALVLFTSVASFAQCDKKVKWKATKAELIDENGQVSDTKEGNISITADSKTVTLEIEQSPNDKLEGTINESTCEWKEAFKNGKTVLKTSLNERGGDVSPGTITIEGKDGKLTITLEIEKMNGKKVRIAIDKYETI
jgi:hypothetical protein